MIRSSPPFLLTFAFLSVASILQPPHRFGAVAQMTKHHAANLRDAGVIPDVIDNFDPQVQIRITYDSLLITPGATILPRQGVHMPQVTLEGSQPGHLYTLFMSDPDAPSPEHPSHREYLHWIVSNIPGGANDIAEGTEVVPYAPPTPPQGTHRYVLTVMEQPGTNPMTVRRPAQRGGFRTRTFGKEAGMDVVGATFFKAAHQSK